MDHFWIELWTVIWFGGLGVFSLLSVIVIIFGGGDLIALLASLRARHLAGETGASSEGDTPA